MSSKRRERRRVAPFSPFESAIFQEADALASNLARSPSPRMSVHACESRMLIKRHDGPRTSRGRSDPVLYTRTYIITPRAANTRPFYEKLNATHASLNNIYGPTNHRSEGRAADTNQPILHNERCLPETNYCFKVLTMCGDRVLEDHTEITSTPASTRH